MKNINGTRTCRECNGIIHGVALRTKMGKRRIYFDSMRCAIDYFKRDFDIRIDDEQLKNYVLEYCCEYVNVVSQ